MEIIKIIFFAIGTFFGVENSKIIAEEAEVNIDTQKRIITVNQKNLFTMVQNQNDSITVANELYHFVNPNAEEKSYKWREALKDFESKNYTLTTNKNTKQLNLNIELKYSTNKDLKVFSIDYVEAENSYAIINIPSWNIKTTKGKLKGNYWYFKDEIIFTMSPAKNMPETYKPHIKGLFEIYNKVKQ